MFGFYIFNSEITGFVNFLEVLLSTSTFFVNEEFESKSIQDSQSFEVSRHFEFSFDRFFEFRIKSCKYVETSTCCKFSFPNQKQLCECASFGGVYFLWRSFTGGGVNN